MGIEAKRLANQAVLEHSHKNSVKIIRRTAEEMLYFDAEREFMN